ncbi:MAG: hypothetical protein ACR2PG_08885, partial [Hyphomicrobiaceae bacterium]
MISSIKGKFNADTVGASSEALESGRRESGYSQDLAPVSKSESLTVKPIEVSDWYTKFGPFDVAPQLPAKSLMPIDWIGIDVTSDMHQPVESFTRGSEVVKKGECRRDLGQATGDRADSGADEDTDLPEPPEVSTCDMEGSGNTFILRNGSYDCLALDSLDDEEEACTCVAQSANINAVANQSIARRCGGIAIVVTLLATSATLTLFVMMLGL